jgi:hypothetical protein
MNLNVNGLLSPTLSSRGGEGEQLARRFSGFQSATLVTPHSLGNVFLVMYTIYVQKKCFAIIKH